MGLFPNAIFNRSITWYAALQYGMCYNVAPHESEKERSMEQATEENRWHHRKADLPRNFRFPRAATTTVLPTLFS